MSFTVYADIQPRLRAVLIDFVIILTVMMPGGLLLSGVALPGALKFAIVAIAIFMLEAGLVAFTGATIGQRIMGLRVQREDNLGNVGIVSAILRAVTKFWFGWFSLLLVMLTTKSQALHDQLCHTVVIDIRPETRGYDAVAGERSLEDPNYSYPATWRRVVVIAVYMAFEVFAFANSADILAHVISAELLAALMDPELEGVLGIGKFAIFGGTIVYGWQGRLPGAWRKKQRFAPMGQS